MRPYLERVFSFLGTVAYRAPSRIILASVAAAAICVWFAYKHLVVINDPNAIISEKSPVHGYYLTYRKEFQVEEDYVVAIHSPDPAINRKLAEQIGVRLESLEPEVRRIFYRLDFSNLEKRLLLFLPLDELQKIQKELASYASSRSGSMRPIGLATMLDEAIRGFQGNRSKGSEGWEEEKKQTLFFARFVEGLSDALEGAPPAASASPLRETAEAEGRADDIEKLFRLKEENEFLSFDDGKILMVLASPGVNISQARRHETIVQIREILDEVRSEAPGVSIGLTGEPVLADDELEISGRDSLRASIVSFALVGLLFLVGFKEVKRPLIAMIVLSVGIAWSLGFATLTVGHLNIISQAFVVMVIGEGLDFSIQITGRYEEGLAAGKRVPDAIQEALKHTGIAVFTGGGTMALAFFTMCFNEFVGLAEFGWISGAGILLCLLASMTALPASFSWMDGRKDPATLQAEAAKLWRFSGERRTQSPKRRAPLLAGALLVTLICFFEIPRVRFDYNLLHLQNRNIESVREELALVESPASSIIYAVSIAPDFEKAKQKIEAFRQLDSVEGVRSLLDFFPENQEKKLPVVRQIVETARTIPLGKGLPPVEPGEIRLKVGRLLAECQKALDDAETYRFLSPRAREAAEVLPTFIRPLHRVEGAWKRFDEKTLAERLDRFQRIALDPARIGIDWLQNQQYDRGVTVADIPKQLLERYRSANGNLLIEILPKENVWERQADLRFVNQVRSVDPRVTGTPVQNLEYVELLRRAYVTAAGWAFAAIAIVVFLHFRNFLYTALALSPLILSAIWLLGTMPFVGESFNPANIVTLPLAIGIGVGYGIYVVDRYAESPGRSVFDSSTGKSVLLTGLTTIIGSGCLMLSKYSGFSSLGFVLSYGITISLVVSLAVLPEILGLLSGRAEPNGEERNS